MFKFPLIPTDFIWARISLRDFTLYGKKREQQRATSTITGLGDRTSEERLKEPGVFGLEER